jgi:hypothetical protein
MFFRVMRFKVKGERIKERAGFRRSAFGVWRNKGVQGSRNSEGGWREWERRKERQIKAQS